MSHVPARGAVINTVLNKNSPVYHKLVHNLIPINNREKYLPRPVTRAPIVVPKHSGHKRKPKLSRAGTTDTLTLMPSLPLPAGATPKDILVRIQDELKKIHSISTSLSLNDIVKFKSKSSKRFNSLEYIINNKKLLLVINQRNSI